MVRPQLAMGRLAQTETDHPATSHGDQQRHQTMTKYVLLYRGSKGMGETPEETQHLAEAWMAWYQQLGTAIIDGGHAFGPATTLTANNVSSDGAPSELTGYVIIQTDSAAVAEQLAVGCPALDAPDGRIEVHEALAY